MRITTWNCCMALHKKFDLLLTLGSDAMAIQECSREFVEQLSDPYSGAWVGSNVRKGLAVIAKHPFVVVNHEQLAPNLSMRATLTGPMELDVYALWSCKGTGGNYVRQTHKLLDAMPTVTTPTVLLGDFNSNATWDHEHGDNSHSKAVDRLSQLGMRSAYHDYFGEPQGAERRPTTFFQKKLGKPYHIDYVFLSDHLRMTGVDVGLPATWVQASDHMPVTVDVGT